MPDLAVAHLTVRQAHVQTGSGQGGIGELLKEAVQPGGIGGKDSVSGLAVCHAEPVHNNQSGRCFIHEEPSFME